MEKVLRAKDMVRVKDLRAKELLRVKVSLKKTSGEIWIETEPLLVHCTMGHIVFDVAGVDRLDTVVPYLIYEEKVHSHGKSLMHFPTARDGCQALEMTVVFQPKETLIAELYGSRLIETSFEKFKNSLTDPNDFLYMDMESLYNNIYPVDEVNVEE